MSRQGTRLDAKKVVSVIIYLICDHLGSEKGTEFISLMPILL